MSNTIMREQARPHMHNVFMLSFDDELTAVLHYLLLTGSISGYTFMHTYCIAGINFSGGKIFVVFVVERQIH